MGGRAASHARSRPRSAAVEAGVGSGDLGRAPRSQPSRERAAFARGRCEGFCLATAQGQLAQLQGTRIKAPTRGVFVAMQQVPMYALRLHLEARAVNAIRAETGLLTLCWGHLQRREATRYQLRDFGVRRIGGSTGTVAVVCSVRPLARGSVSTTAWSVKEAGLAGERLYEAELEARLSGRIKIKALDGLRGYTFVWQGRCSCGQMFRSSRPDGRHCSKCR